MDSTCVLVLGMHRGGTSATSQVLHKLGVDMNPTSGSATWEDVELQLLHEAAIGSWLNPRPHFELIIGQYTRALRERAKKPLWGYKDPRLNFLLIDVLGVLNALKVEVKVVNVYRDYWPSVKSIVRMNPGLTENMAKVVVSNYGIAREQSLMAYKGPVVEIEYDRLIDHTVLTVRALADFVDRPMASDAIRAVRPELRHFTRSEA